MSKKNFVSYGDVESVLSTYANRIKLSPTTFTGKEQDWDQLTDQQKSVYNIVNITDDGGSDITIVSDTTSVNGVLCYKNGAVKQITFSGCTAASIPTGFRPLTDKYLGFVSEDNSKEPVLIFAASDGTVTVQELGTANVLTVYSLYGTLTYIS